MYLVLIPRGELWGASPEVSSLSRFSFVPLKNQRHSKKVPYHNEPLRSQQIHYRNLRSQDCKELVWPPQTELALSVETRPSLRHQKARWRLQRHDQRCL